MSYVVCNGAFPIICVITLLGKCGGGVCAFSLLIHFTRYIHISPLIKNSQFLKHLDLELMDSYPLFDMMVFGNGILEIC